MIRLIVGKKGTGKTKVLIDKIDVAAKVTDGNVVCVDKTDKLKFDISYKVRLIDVDTYGIEGFESFYGFIAGILSANYDITDICVDSILKIVGRNYDNLGLMLEKIEKISENVNIVFTVSADESELPDSVKKYL